MIRISDFQTKDVVNVSDGKKLGNISDLDINLETGKIRSIIIYRSQRVLGFFGKDEDLIISWNNIVKIGTDVILVKYSPIYEANDFKEKSYKD
ncbi:MAG: YlmC/YmxH family sporulation protein [Bacillales bacterium]|jgi:YlmC/YmxH family sporulation protein|nr:YlmC/YmxH family sporulation protein [Bacillales bacterium]